MPYKVNEKLLSWGTDVEGGTLAQAAMASTMPFIKGHIALMPDAHIGKGATIGSVIPTEGAIIPAAVGVDIGCGMIAVETIFDASDLPEDLAALLSRVEQVVPAGVGQGHEHSLFGDNWLRDNYNYNVDTDQLAGRAVSQFGTLGSGNHFVEVCLDKDDNVWVVLHSGSRGVGNKLAMKHIAIAKGLMKEYFIKLPDPDLAYLVENTTEFDEYMADLMWAQAYALANREQMMDAVMTELVDAIGYTDTYVNNVEERRINCHHNYTARENHMGRNMWITRKGAIRARENDYGVIPGSMGTNTFIVKGLGNKASYDSSAHGAGRRMSRSQAKRDLTVESLAEAMDGKMWLADKSQSLLDEHPDSYKDIHRVMADQADLVEVEVELHQVLNYKGA